MSKSVRPTINDIEGNSGGGAIAGNQEEDGFARMMEPFDQDKEEELIMMESIQHWLAWQT